MFFGNEKTLVAQIRELLNRVRASSSKQLAAFTTKICVLQTFLDPIRKRASARPRAA